LASAGPGTDRGRLGERQTYRQTNPTQADNYAHDTTVKTAIKMGEHTAYNYGETRGTNLLKDGLRDQ
jgi:hypothetical protein